MYQLIDQLETNHILSEYDFARLIRGITPELFSYLSQKANAVRSEYYGKKVYIRGLIEFSNYCKNDCFYCGIRRSNQNALRYRLTKEDILDCCKEGYQLGFRTFVLQGGEDPYYTDSILVDIISSIRRLYQDCAITLSIGERTQESYQKLFQAGCDRYLLRHETADDTHYSQLHPASLSLSNRKACLLSLKKIGYQVGTGFMVGSPYQTPEHLAKDMIFIKELNPQMVGIGPFIPHHDTPFADFPAGSAELTLFMIGLLRLMLPSALIPSTTALGTIDPNGREKGISSGANVVMPNLSPLSVREKYLLYDNKICTGDESAQCLSCMENRMKKIGFQVVVDRGDYIEITN